MNNCVPWLHLPVKDVDVAGDYDEGPGKHRKADNGKPSFPSII